MIDKPLKVILTQEPLTFRERLIGILQSEALAFMIIMLRSGKEIEITQDPVTNPRGNVRVWVGEDYIEVDVAPGAGAVPAYEVVLLSEIASIHYF